MGIYDAENSKTTKLKKAYVVEDGKTSALKKCYVVENGKTVKLWSAESGRFVALAKDAAGWGIFSTTDLVNWEKHCSLDDGPNYYSATNFFKVNSRYFLTYQGGGSSVYSGPSYLFYSDDNCESWTRGVSTYTLDTQPYYEWDERLNETVEISDIRKIKDRLIGRKINFNRGTRKHLFFQSFDGVNWDWFEISPLNIDDVSVAGPEYYNSDFGDYVFFRLCPSSYEGYDSGPYMYLGYFNVSYLDTDAKTNHYIHTLQTFSGYHDTEHTFQLTSIGLTSTFSQYSASYSNYGVRGATFTKYTWDSGAYQWYLSLHTTGNLTDPNIGGCYPYVFQSNTDVNEMYFLFETKEYYTDGSGNYEYKLRYVDLPLNYPSTNAYGVDTNAAKALYPLHDSGRALGNGEYLMGVYLDGGLCLIGVAHDTGRVYRYDRSNYAVTIYDTSLIFEGNLYENKNYSGG